MATDQRRLAADARRVVEPGNRQEAAEIRTTLKRNYERGREAGRAEVRAELTNHDSRSTLLNCSADFLDAAQARATSIPNSTRTISALREAGALLRDAATLGEPQAEAMGVTEAKPEEAEPDKATKRAKKKDG